MDESALIKKHVRSINFLKNVSPAKETSAGTSQANSEGEFNQISNSSRSSCQSNATSARIDSIKSCESVLKIFTFETHNFNKNNEKCLAFWNTLKERKDILPVDCTIMDANNNRKDSECQTEQQESEASLWARALYELRKRKLDVVALATDTDTCKYCKTINCFHMAAGFTPSDLEENLAELDNWSPRTRNKATQFNTKDTCKDVATSVPPEFSQLGQLLSRDLSEHSSDKSESGQESTETKSESGNEGTEIKSESGPEEESSSTPVKESQQETDAQKQATTMRSIGFVPKTKSTSVGVPGTKPELKVETGPEQIAGSSKISLSKSFSKEILSGRRLSDVKLKDSHDTSELSKKRVSISEVIKVSSKTSQTVSKDSQLNKTSSKPSTKRSSFVNKGEVADKTAQEEIPASKVVTDKTLSSERINVGSSTNFKQISFSATKIFMNTSTSKLARGASKEILKISTGRLSESSKLDIPIRKIKAQSWNEVSSGKPNYESEPNIVDSSISKYRKTVLDEIKGTHSETKVRPSILLSSLKKISDAEIKMAKEESSYIRKKSKVEFEPSKVRDQFTDTQNLSSLFHIETIKRLKQIADRKEKLESRLRSSLLNDVAIQLDTGEVLDPRVYLCSCLETLKKTTCDACPCREGICQKPKKSDLKKIEQMLNHMPIEERDKMKCFVKLIYQIQAIIEEDLDTEAMDAKIIDVLAGIDPCKCDGEPCECKIHHLNLVAIERDRNYMAATVLDKLNEVLDERYEARLGEVIKKNPTLATVSINTDEPSVVNVGIPEKHPCNICRMQNCACILK